MAFGAVTLGQLTLTEIFVQPLSETSDGAGVATVTVVGQESVPPLTITQLRQRREDLIGLQGYMLPVLFTDKAEHNGFYQVATSQASVVSWQGEVATFDWSVTLTFIGPDNQVEIESRFVQPLTRTNAYSLNGSQWHGPPIGHYAYYLGGASPGRTAVRVGADGNQTVYFNLPTSNYARWGIAAASYLTGEARILQNGVIRSGVNLVSTASGWQMDNGLVNVSAGVSSTLNVSHYTSSGAAYRGKAFNVSVAGSAAGNQIAGFEAVSVLRNDPEAVVIRLVENRNPGKAMLDLQLRRGSRIVEAYLQSDVTSQTLAVWLGTTEATNNVLAACGYVTATANDTFGNRYIIGSATGGLALHASGGLSHSLTSKLDFFIGDVIGGSAAIGDDNAGQLLAQYISPTPETTSMALR